MTTMTTTTETTYLGVFDGEHVWTDGTRLPMLAGFDDPDPDDPPGDDPPEPDPDDDDEPDDHEDEPEKQKHKPKQRPERQAAQYRVQRNEARRERDALTEERDSLRLELAFTRAAGSRFVDLDAAWKLHDATILTVDIDGTPVGAQEAVDALIEANPFLAADDDEEPAQKDKDPFNTATGSSGRTMNGKRKPMKTGFSRKELEARYPALRRGR